VFRDARNRRAISTAAKGVLVLPRDTRVLDRFVPKVELRLQEDLPKMVLEYLGIDYVRLGR
jgi:hypothetical protein